MGPSVFRALHRDASEFEGSQTNVRGICLLVDLPPEDLQGIEGRLRVSRRKVRAGSALFCAGDPFEAVYEVWTGFFKTVKGSPLGFEQIMGFQMSGDLIGLEAMGSETHGTDAIALEDSHVWVMPYQDLSRLARELPKLQHHLNRLMGSELARAGDSMLMLGSMHAEERVAAFFLDLIQRLGERGFASNSVQLRMSRAEIGSFLGLTLETVSRTLTSLQAAGLMHVHNREITVMDPVALRQIVEGPPV